ncbi:hypothetical protein [Hydrogenophilus thermoluteolus]|uniref:hypothetical protein n=1 Tax=Hydrogenophilus thermoluteolus TaxID=297 RepID=UPI003F667822
MTLWALDTIERVRDGVRRYILTLVDPVSRCAFALALPKRAAERLPKRSKRWLLSHVRSLP